MANMSFIFCQPNSLQHQINRMFDRILADNEADCQYYSEVLPAKLIETTNSLVLHLDVSPVQQG